jgi:hypothetical protein
MAANEDRIRQRAYEIWEQEGRPHGEDMKHWLQAFEEIAASAGTSGQAVKRRATNKAAVPNLSAKAKPAGKSKAGAQSAPTTTPPEKTTRTTTGAAKH